MDGTIRIDTKINSEGVNQGTKNITNKFGGIVKALKFVGVAMGLAFSARSIGNLMRSTLASFDLMTSKMGGSVIALKNSFAGLKGAFANVALSLISALTPVLLIVIGWLTMILTLFAQFINLLFGVQIAAGAAAGAAGDLTDNTKAAGKAAKGALAPFDELNVLQKNDAGGGGGGGATIPGLPALSPELLAKFEAFKIALLALLQPAIDAFNRLKIALAPLGATLWAGLKWAWDNILVPLGTWSLQSLLPAFLDLLGAAGKLLNSVLIALKPMGLWFWNNFLLPLATWTGGAIIGFLEWLIARLYDLSAWIDANPDAFQAITVGVIAFGIAMQNAALIAALTGVTSWLALMPIIILIALLVVAGYMLVTNWEYIKIAAAYLAQVISAKWNEIWSNVSNTWNLMGLGWNVLLDAMRNKVISIGTSISNTFYNIINGIIGFINGGIARIIGGINNMIGMFNMVSGFLPGGFQVGYLGVPQIPRLATGAVIPPNAAFAAILGDQKSGTNIEAPESLIRKILQDELGNIKADITINFAGSLAALVRELKPHIDNENIRIGKSLVAGSVKV